MSKLKDLIIELEGNFEEILDGQVDGMSKSELISALVKKMPGTGESLIAEWVSNYVWGKDQIKLNHQVDQR